MSENRARLGDAAFGLLLIGLWVFAALAARTTVEFPVLDDWAYAYSVRTLVEQGQIRFSDWGATNLISQVFWGALFAKVFGFGYGSLRLSTLVLAALGHLALFATLRLNGVARGLALLATLCSMFNPLSFFLSFSFMSDVPFAAAQSLAICALVWGSTRRKAVATGIGWAMTVVAQLCRQVAIAIPIGHAAARLASNRWTVRLLLGVLGPILLLVFVQVAFQAAIRELHLAPNLYGRQINDIGSELTHAPLMVARHVAKFTFLAPFYFGLFLLPVSLATAPSWSRSVLPGGERSLRIMLPAVAVCGLAYAVLCPRGARFPMWRDTLTIKSGYGSDWTGVPLPEGIVFLATALAAAGALLLVPAIAAVLAEWWRNRRKQHFDARLFGLVTAIVLMAPIAVIAMRFDRYLIPVIPCALLALTPARHAGALNWRWMVAGAIVLAPMAAFAVAGTHDYMAWKGVQANAYADLLRSTPPSRIDAGWVLNGPTNFGRYGSVTQVNHWYERADYVIARVPRPGYVVAHGYPVQQVLPWARKAPPILVLRSVAAPGP
jgi:hypothetical protein